MESPLPGQSPTGGGGDDQSWLYPKYINNVNVFICPSTQNYIRTTNFFTNWLGDRSLYDLSYYAATKKKSPGSSYEVSGFWGDARQNVAYARKTSANVLTWVYRCIPLAEYQYNRAYVGTIANPSCALLFNDGDDGYGGTRNNFPDPIDNHGAAGTHGAFCDGHAVWVSAHPESKWITTLYLGCDCNP